jgi:hypothetical protein
MGRFTTIRRLQPAENEIEMALAWLRGDLTLTDIAKARGKFNASNSLAWVAPRLRAAFAVGRLVIKEDKRPQAFERMPSALNEPLEPESDEPVLVWKRD